jgi:hypothetical protein
VDRDCVHCLPYLEPCSVSDTYEILGKYQMTVYWISGTE